MNLLPMMAALPESPNFDEWIDDWTNFATGKGSAVGSSADGGDPLISFYLQNKDYLTADSAIINNMSGWLQNGVYGLLHGLAWLTNLMVQAALAPLYYLPKYIMDPNNSLHLVYYGAIGIGVSLILLSFLSRIPGYLSGGRGDELKSATKNGVFTTGMLLVMPFLFVGGANLTHSLMTNVAQEAMNPITPLAANTVDLEEWAMDNFNELPFTGENAKVYNSLNVTKEVPDFATGIDNDQIKMLDALIKEKGGTTNEKAPEVFRFKLQVAPTDPAVTDSDQVQYGLTNMKLDKGILNIASPQYKRYKVNNLAAISSYIIFIFVTLMMSIKIARASLGTIANLIGGAIAAGRDGAKSTEGVKNSTMEIFNNCMGIFLDFMMLYVFMQLTATLPQSIAKSVTGTTGGFGYGLIYVFVLAMLGLVAFNGSSALERQFGMQSGAKGQAGTIRAMTAPGMMMGAALGGALGYASGKRKENKMKEALEKSKEPTPPKNQSNQPRNNKGEDIAKQMEDNFGEDDDGSTPPGGGGGSTPPGGGDGPTPPGGGGGSTPPEYDDEPTPPRGGGGSTPPEYDDEPTPPRGGGGSTSPEYDDEPTPPRNGVDVSDFDEDTSSSPRQNDGSASVESLDGEDDNANDSRNTINNSLDESMNTEDFSDSPSRRNIETELDSTRGNATDEQPVVTQNDLNKNAKIQKLESEYNAIVAKNKAKNQQRTQNQKQRAAQMINDLERSAEDPVKPVK